MQVERC